MCANAVTGDWSKLNTCSTYYWLENSDDLTILIPNLKTRKHKLYSVMSAGLKHFLHTLDVLNNKTSLEIGSSYKSLFHQQKLV